MSDQQKQSGHKAPASERAEARAGESEWVQDLSAPSGEAIEPERPEDPPKPNGPQALVIDDGDLEDICEMLDELGAETCRVVLSQGAVPEIRRPSRLFVTSAREALSTRFPPSDNGDDVTSIAIANDSSHTMSTMMRRLGFDYVVRRPVHPEALRLLMLQALFRGPEKRRAGRFALGCEVAWKSGWRKGGTCELVEISARGCRLMMEEKLPLDVPITIRVPPEVAGGSLLILRGSVVRRHQQGKRADLTAVAVAFDDFSKKVQKQLDALLHECATGPAARMGEPAEARPPRPAPAPEPRVLTLTRDETAEDLAPWAPVAEPEPPEPASSAGLLARVERRKNPRGLFGREIVALDAHTSRVTHTLMGTDLSANGIRVEPHHHLNVGARLRIALYDAHDPHPVTVVAEVARDDGTNGYLLLFQRVDPDSRARLEAMVDALPVVESFGDRDTERVFLGEILLTDEVSSS